MTDIGEEFVLLNQERVVKDSQLVTRIVRGLPIQWEVRLGLDSGGFKHLLFRIGNEAVRGDSRSRGVELRAWELVEDFERSRFLDLWCRDAALGLAFDRLVEDVLRRMLKPGADPHSACSETLDDWRALLRVVGTTDRETIIGLTGELEVLRLLAAADPTTALGSWRGPDAAVHDFALRGRALEVKTTSGVDAALVSISNLDQLDATGLEALHLVVVHVREDDGAPDLDERIRALIDLGLPRDELIRAVADAGHVFEATHGSIPRFRVRSVRVWSVGEGFPGLTRASLQEAQLKGVSRVKYDLSLDAAPARMTDQEAEMFIREWSRS